MRKFSILNLSSLHPYGKPNLGYAARRWFTLLGDGSPCSATVHTARRWFTLHDDGSHCSAMVHNYSVTHHDGRTMSLTARLCSHLLRQVQDGVAQWVQGARGLAVGGMYPDTHSRPHGLCPQGWPSPQDKALRGTTLVGAFRKISGRYPKDTMRSVRICMIPRFL